MKRRRETHKVNEKRGKVKGRDEIFMKEITWSGKGKKGKFCWFLLLCHLPRAFFLFTEKKCFSRSYCCSENELHVRNLGVYVRNVHLFSSFYLPEGAGKGMYAREQQDKQQPAREDANNEMIYWDSCEVDVRWWIRCFTASQLLIRLSEDSCCFSTPKMTFMIHEANNSSTFRRHRRTKTSSRASSLSTHTLVNVRVKVEWWKEKCLRFEWDGGESEEWKMLSKSSRHLS